MVYLHSKQKLVAFKDSLYSGFLRAAELRAKTGETNRLEMITVRSQSLEVKNQLRQLDADLDIYTKKLQTLLNSAIAHYPADSILHCMAFSTIADSSALLANPSVGYMQQQVEISRLEKKVERSQIIPDFSIGWVSPTKKGIQDINGVPGPFGLEDCFTGIQAGISIPLWFIPYTSKAKAANLKEKMAQTNAEYYSKSVMSDYSELLGE